MARHRVQVLHDAGFSHRQIAHETGIPRRTVRRICEEPPLSEGAGGAAPIYRGAGRPSVVAEFGEFVVATLTAEPDLPTLEVLHRVRGRGYTGGKSALYELVRAVRSRDTRIQVRFEGLPAEFSQHDFGEVAVRYRNGKRETIHFFASRLKYSRWVDVRLVGDQRVESLVRSLILGFEAFGGVPLVAVFDNPKTIVVARQGSKIVWNETFGQVALDYRFGPELCTPGRGEEKGSVENLVGFVKNSFFKVRRFEDREDLESQLVEWLLEVNTVRPCRATNEIPAKRLMIEQERLRPLSIAPKDYALRFPIVVGPTGKVSFQGRRYSMDPEALGVPGTLWLYENRVRIQARRFVSEHDRYPAIGMESILPEHRTARLAKVSGARGRLYLMRQEILDLGPVAETFLTELVHRHRFTWQAEVESLHRGLSTFGPLALYRSLAYACERQLFAAQHVLEHLVREAA